jgi:hypothetical protein
LAEPRTQGKRHRKRRENLGGASLQANMPWAKQISSRMAEFGMKSDAKRSR